MDRKQIIPLKQLGGNSMQTGASTANESPQFQPISAAFTRKTYLIGSYGLLKGALFG